jgi:hypothetical protein
VRWCLALRTGLTARSLIPNPKPLVIKITYFCLISKPQINIKFLL